MSFWSRIVNVVRGDRFSREIDEELQSHIAEAVAQGRDPREARLAFGSALRLGEESRDIRLVAWLDCLRADAVFGWRQLAKKKVTSAAAILSLALAIGACTSAFRLIDALLLRPLPVAEPERLYAVSYEGFDAQGRSATWDSCSYPMFRQWRATLGKQAELIAVSYAERADLTYGSDQQMEKAYRQFVSGWMFRSFGLRPAVGRLLDESDDLEPGTQPYAVLSYDYWTRRFAQDPAIVGRGLRFGNTVLTIVGVAQEPFTGTETGAVTDIFVPMMMHDAGALSSSNSFWFRTLVRLQPGAAGEPVRQQLAASYRAFEQQRSPGHDRIPKERLLLEPAAAGVSRMQQDYRRALLALGVLVALVLLIACANVANLMTAQAAARAREMALRASIGAGRWRLVQLVLVESAWLAFLAAGLGGLIAWQAAPVVVGMINPPDNPARLSLPMDWRVLGFGLALALAVIFLFGLAPALNASAVKPASALKGGQDPHSRRRLMHGLIAVQVAFCFLVHFVAGLFVGTFDRLANQPTGFSAARILLLDTVSERAQPRALWDQVAEHLRATPGVETVALAGWPLLSGQISNMPISVAGAPPGKDPAWFLNVSPGWLDAMKIPVEAGRDFRASDLNPGAAIVSDAFAKLFFHGVNPVGQTFETVIGANRSRFEIVGLVHDTRYRDIRGPILPLAFVPLGAADRRSATLIVRTATANPLALASGLRQEVPRAHPEFRVSNMRTQGALDRSLTVRERLLATLAMFFAAVALLLAGIGLYGVLDYSVLQRRREIGIRMAIGAQAGDIARLVTMDVFSMVLAGALAGVALGMGSVRYIEALLYQVKPTDLGVLAPPSLTILAAAVVAAAPAVIRAVRIDPVAMLRAD